MKPNFLFILTDDQGPWAVPWKMPELKMPNLNGLAEEGKVFDQFYCASPVCSPARASLMTGRMPSAHGVHDWLAIKDQPYPQSPRYLEGIDTLPQLLQGGGYYCGHAGKWHLGDASQTPAGFDYFWSHRFGGGRYYQAPTWEDGQKSEEPGYFTDGITRHAKEFFEQYQNEGEGKPFYLQLWTTAPHDPWDSENHPEELLAEYEGCEFPSVPKVPAHPWTRARMQQFNWAFADPNRALKGYCAALGGVDRLIGQVRQQLEAYGLADNTIIIYQADNGFSCGHHGVWGKGNGTYPLNFWENSVQVPCVFYVPPALKTELGVTNLESDQAPASALSYLPTICDFAGVAKPSDPLCDAPSLRPRFESPAENAGQKDTEENAAIAVFDEYGGGRMIKKGNHKLILRLQGPNELYDLASDPKEANNLLESEGEQARIQALKAELEEQLEKFFYTHHTQAFDGYQLPVTGCGQHTPLWEDKGERAFHQGLTTEAELAAHPEIETDFSGEYWWR
ncbi:hypothetical protein BSR28_00370 [Boudabousia liubingyangii]|uniref:sulfatase-like hydrolase/transferase n=1 Tax=Boudabousia liubingyangii TaxID=1921764 RepID=UPI00093B3D21|nr:sulfatase-like hydrolase/transferase [Boudabousia liubingyangii]OKL48205.1 hypothetical protein BSR28_00370 [Boudabousia liubingyangii]